MAVRIAALAVQEVGEGRADRLRSRSSPAAASAVEGAEEVDLVLRPGGHQISIAQ